MIIIYMNINNEYIKEIYELVNKLCPNIRKPKYDFYYYIENIILMLTDLIKWSSLKKIHKNKKKYHYKTIYRTFVKWSKLNIFNIAYDNIIKKYALEDINSSTILNLFLIQQFQLINMVQNWQHMVKLKNIRQQKHLFAVIKIILVMVPYVIKDQNTM